MQTWLDSFDLSALTPAQRQQLEAASPASSSPKKRRRPTPTQQVKNLHEAVAHAVSSTSIWARWSLQLFQFRQFHFKNFYHPFVCDFAKLVYNPLKGIPALMSRETQLKDTGFSFRQSYQPTPWVVEPSTEEFYPQEVVDFTPDGAYSPYNWELFFHAPLLIANSLSKNQRFEEARDWYHFIFNPIGVESAVAGRLADEQVLDHQAVLRDHRPAVRPAAHRQHPADAGRRHERARLLGAGASRTSKTRCSTGAPTPSSRTASPTTARSPTRRRW